MSIQLLTEEEKVRVRYHLGYVNVGQASTFVLGTPASVDVSFILENAFLKILPAALSLVRELIGKCDACDAQLLEDMPNLAVDAVCDIKLRSDEMQQLDMRYERWRTALANCFGVYPNPYDKRTIGGPTLNVPVLG
jgi:hypothetical protein